MYQSVGSHLLHVLEGVEVGVVFVHDVVQQFGQSALVEAVGSHSAHLDGHIVEQLVFRWTYHVEELLAEGGAVGIMCVVACYACYGTV